MSVEPHKVVPSARRLAACLALLACAAAPDGGRQAAGPAQERLTEERLRADAAGVVRGGGWKRRLEALDGAVAAAAAGTTLRRGPALFARLADDPVMRLALSQAGLIRRAGPEVLERVGRDAAAFLEWLLGNRDAMDGFLETVRPEDDAEQALRVWARLWDGDAEGRDKYRNLAMACALVFDKPPWREDSRIEVAERYDFYRKQAEKGVFQTVLSELPAWELVWVVDAPVPPAELAWALDHVSLPRAEWARAYEMVPYSMGKAIGREDNAARDTLEGILKAGGVCADRAYFAAVTAKAHGIPAMAITGEGARGDHAWFGYKATRRDWNLDAGRYEQDRYATGYALESQTGKRVKEHSLRLLADEQRRSPAWGRAETLVRLGDSLAASGRGEGAGQVYEMAVAAAPRHLGAWTARIGQMKRAAQPGAAWEKAFRDMRVAFRDYPDVLATVDALETERMLGKAAPADVGRTVGRQSRDIALHHEDRTDLVLETIVRQIALLEKAGEPEAVAAAYRKALRQYGDNAVVFRRLAGDYFDFGGRTNARGAALRDIDATFRRCYASAPAGDFFAMNAYAGMMDMMAGFYEQDGQADKAERLRRGAEKLLKTAQGGARYRK